jgi:Flp pilus assembly protein TadG
MKTIMSRLRRFDRAQSGASAEFALIMPVFLAMLFGIVVFGAYLGVVHDVQQLAAEAARSSVAGPASDAMARCL